MVIGKVEVEVEVEVILYACTDQETGDRRYIAPSWSKEFDSRAIRLR